MFQRILSVLSLDIILTLSCFLTAENPLEILKDFLSLGIFIISNVFHGLFLILLLLRLSLSWCQVVKSAIECKMTSSVLQSSGWLHTIFHICDWVYRGTVSSFRYLLLQRGLIQHPLSAHIVIIR
jgi:hypothetical protein